MVQIHCTFLIETIPHVNGLWKRVAESRPWWSHQVKAGLRQRRVFVCSGLFLLNKSRTNSGYCGKPTIHHLSSTGRDYSSMNNGESVVWSQGSQNYFHFAAFNQWLLRCFFFSASRSLAMWSRHIEKRVLAAPQIHSGGISPNFPCTFPFKAFLFLCSLGLFETAEGNWKRAYSNPSATYFLRR